MSPSSKKFFCPTCRKPLTWSKDNPFRPFCGERCKLIDLGAWADEKHHIPGPVEDGLLPGDAPDDKDRKH